MSKTQAPDPARELLEAFPGCGDMRGMESWCAQVRAFLRTPIPAPEGADEPEPAAWLVTWKGGEHLYCHAHASELPAVDQARIMGGKCEPLYRVALAAPAPKAPVALTDEQLTQILASHAGPTITPYQIARAVEAAHGIPAPQTKEQP